MSIAPRLPFFGSSVKQDTEIGNGRLLSAFKKQTILNETPAPNVTPIHDVYREIPNNISSIRNGELPFRQIREGYVPADQMRDIITDESYTSKYTPVVQRQNLKFGGPVPGFSRISKPVVNDISVRDTKKTTEFTEPRNKVKYVINKEVHFPKSTITANNEKYNIYNRNAHVRITNKRNYVTESGADDHDITVRNRYQVVTRNPNENEVYVKQKNIDRGVDTTIQTGNTSIPEYPMKLASGTGMYDAKRTGLKNERFPVRYVPYNKFDQKVQFVSGNRHAIDNVIKPSRNSTFTQWRHTPATVVSKDAALEYDSQPADDNSRGKRNPNVNPVFDGAVNVVHERTRNIRHVWDHEIPDRVLAVNIQSVNTSL
jgi:hypothetical protein